MNFEERQLSRIEKDIGNHPQVPGPPTRPDAVGYSHPSYARSLREFGEPFELPHCKGWLLSRAIPGYRGRDATGCYPLFACANWSRLGDDLERLAGSLVSISLVADPFGDFGHRQLEDVFEHVVHFKQHFVVDLSTPIDRIGSRDHRRNARKAARSVDVEVSDPPARYSSEWVELYSMAMRRRGVSGIQAFSKLSLLGQLAVPGATLFRASVGGRTIGCDLWLETGDVAYFHLGALNAEGYSLSASHLLKLVAINYFRTRVSVLDLGGGAGLAPRPDDGLVRFKQRWSTGSVPVYFCGRVLDRGAFDTLSAQGGASRSSYFPPYRAGEFQ